MNKADLDDFLIFLRSQDECLIKAEPGEDLGPIYVSAGEELNEYKYYIYNPSLTLVFNYFKRDREAWEATIKDIEKFPLKDREELIKAAKERFKRIGSVCEFKSEVIELIASRTIQEERRITEGRIFVELNDYDKDGHKFNRSHILEALYVKYSKYIKKNFMISANKHYYIGSGAYELYKDGWWMGDHKIMSEINRILF